MTGERVLCLHFTYTLATNYRATTAVQMLNGAVNGRFISAPSIITRPGGKTFRTTTMPRSWLRMCWNGQENRPSLYGVQQLIDLYNNYCCAVAIYSKCLARLQEKWNGSDCLGKGAERLED